MVLCPFHRIKTFGPARSKPSLKQPPWYQVSKQIGSKVARNRSKAAQNQIGVSTDVVGAVAVAEDTWLDANLLTMGVIGKSALEIVRSGKSDPVQLKRGFKTAAFWLFETLFKLDRVSFSTPEIGQFLTRNFWMISGGPFLSRPLCFTAAVNRSERPLVCLTFWDTLMRASLSVWTKMCSHRCVSLKETP